MSQVLVEDRSNGASPTPDRRAGARPDDFWQTDLGSPNSALFQSSRRLMHVTLDAEHAPAVSIWSDSTDSVSEQEEDQREFESPVNEAASRWGLNRDPAKAEDQALAFYHSVMPGALHLQLQSDPDSRGLLTLVAGMVFTANNDPNIARPADAPPSASKTLLAADLRYLLNTQDPALLSDCQHAANSAVEHCGDRLSFGATQLHQVVEAHQFKSGMLSAKALFDGMARHFNQSLVEARADEIASSDHPDESIEYYQDLAFKVAQTGRPLAEKSTASLYGQMFRVTDRQLQETLDLIDAKNSNPAYLDTFKAHQATVNEVLRTVFKESFESMLARRSALEDQETDALLDPEKSLDEQLKIGVRLGELGQMESGWYDAKLRELLDTPELLES